MQGTDGNYEFQEATVALNGVSTEVIGSGIVWRRIFRAFPDAAVTGEVYIHTSSDAGLDGIPDNPATEILAMVSSAEQQTMMSIYTVPDDYDAAYLRNWCMSNFGGGGADPVTFRLRAVTPSSTASRTQQKMIVGPNVSICVPIEPPLRFPARSDIEVTGIAGVGSNQDVASHFDLYLIP